MNKSGHKPTNGKVPPPADTREALQWFVNNFGLYVGSTRGMFLSDWTDEDQVSLEAAVVNMRSRGFSPMVVSGESLTRQADYLWPEARDKACFGRPVATKLELEAAGCDVLIIDALSAPERPHHMWYLMSYLLYPRAISGKVTIISTSLPYNQFVHRAHACPDPDFLDRRVTAEKLVWLIEATTINQELFRLAREEGLPPLLKAEYSLFTALKERGMEPVCQHVLGDYLLDFALIDGDKKLNIECDTVSALSGHEQQTRDAQRDLVLMTDGWQILKFSAAETLNNPSACADVVEDVWRVGKKRSNCGRVLTGRHVPSIPDPPLDDDDQRAAVSYGGGPAIVVGGSGNGKTTCLVQRVASLLARGIAPELILIVTFSSQTLKPLRSALQAVAEKPIVQRLSLYSWQDLGLKILKENLPSIKRKPPLKIETNRQKVLQRIVAKVKKEFDPMKLELAGEVDDFYVAGLISMYKAHLIAPKRAAEEAGNEADQLIAKIYQAYEDQLLKSNRIDKDDVVACSVQVLLDNLEIRSRYQALFEYVLVDEYQEATPAQDILIRLLAAPQDNLYVTGDEQETVCEQANACPELLRQLSLRFPHARCLVLERNWRCHPEIVDHARQLVLHLQRVTIDRPYYSGWGSATAGAIIGPQPCSGPEQEAAWIAAEIQALISAGRLAGEIAVLYRYDAYQELIKEELSKLGIKFHARHSETSLIPDEVGDMAAYLKLVMDPDGPRAREAFERVSQLGSKEIDPKLSATIASFAEANNLSYLKAVEIYAEATADQSCRELEQLVKIIRAMNMDRLPPGECIGYLRRNRRLNDYYKSVKLPPGTAYEPLKKLQLLEEEARKFPSVAEFVKDIESRQREDDGAEAQDSVHIKSIVDSKGYEFAFVFMPGLAEGILPTEKMIDVEEERRLCYVAFTRARERLYISFPVQIDGKHCLPSRFIGEARLLPSALTVCVQEQSAPEPESFEPQEYSQSTACEYPEESPLDVISDAVLEPSLAPAHANSEPEPVYEQQWASPEQPVVADTEEAARADAGGEVAPEDGYLTATEPAVEAEGATAGEEAYATGRLRPPPSLFSEDEFDEAEAVSQAQHRGESFEQIETEAAPLLEQQYDEDGTVAAEADQHLQPEYEGSTLPRCPACSAFLEGNSRFCGECGYSLPERIPVCVACASPLEPGAKFCGECGTPVAQVGEESSGAAESGRNNWMSKFLNQIDD